MADELRCLTCGIDVDGAEAAQNDCRCPTCGGELSAGAEGGSVEAQRGTGASVKALVVIVLLLVLVGGILVVRQDADVSPDGLADSGVRSREIAEILKKALEINGKTPLMVDKSTRLEQIVVEGEMIISKSTLVNFTAENAGEDIFKGAITPFLAGHYCKAKSTRKALELGVKYGHEYFSNDGVLLYTATIGVGDCL